MLTADTLNGGDLAILSLGELYKSRGYKRFKMSRFEEYDLYAQSKDFLAKEGIVTFTDPSGELMALKPDVTMSIIKNSKELDGVCEKLYYNENVYRIRSGRLLEITQAGLECMGDIDLYSSCEVISLALKSLERFGKRFAFDLSHTGIVFAVLNESSVSEQERSLMLPLIASKNLHEISSLLGGRAKKLERLLSIDPRPGIGLCELRELSDSPELYAAAGELSDICGALGEFEGLRLDFSVASELSYYNGVVFQGFVDGVPEKVLTGGRYDLLMRRMGKKGGALGFAINLSLLERMLDGDSPLDADILLVYGDSPAERVMAKVNELSGDGSRVMAASVMPKKGSFGRVVLLEGE